MNKIKDIVCSLEYAKNLKDLGVKQDSIFGWLVNHGSPEGRIINNDDYDTGTIVYAAFTAEEIIKIIPHYIRRKIPDENDVIYHIEIDTSGEAYCVKYWPPLKVNVDKRDDEVIKGGYGQYVSLDSKHNLCSYISMKCDDFLVNALAKILINLIEEKIISVEEINGRF